jgi:hypothetical protein
MNALRSNLELAIDRAEGFGVCKYVSQGRPVCVIAQLGAIEGVSIEEMERWNGSIIRSVYPKVPKFRKYNKELLTELQVIWDDIRTWERPAQTKENISTARDAMRKLVQEYYTVAPDEVEFVASR